MSDPEESKKAPPAKGPGATYRTPLHPDGVTDTSSDFELGPLRFNPVVSSGSFLLILAFTLWCMLHTACDTANFDGKCSFKPDDNTDQEDCARFAAGEVSWATTTVARCVKRDVGADGRTSNTWINFPNFTQTVNGVSTTIVYDSEDACEDACDDCGGYYPDDAENTKPCPCPCPMWREGIEAHCKAGTEDATELLEGLDEAACNELIANPAIWTVDADEGDKVPLRFNGSYVSSTLTDLATDQSSCALVGGDWRGNTARAAASLTGQDAIEDSMACYSYVQGCHARNLGWSTQDAFDVEVDQDWDAAAEFASWKTWVARLFSWLYIGSQDVWIVFIIIVYFSKHSNMKLCSKDEEDNGPEYSDSSWFSMLFCCGIGVGLFYFGVAEPVWHYTDSSDSWGNRYNRNPALTDSEVAQDAMNLSFYHWGLHGFVVYTQVGLILAIVSHRWGLPMTMKSCFYPLLGDKIFGFLGDAIDVLSVITTLFGVCTSLGLGVMQLSAGLNRLTRDDDAENPSDTGIEDNTTTQIVIIWCITSIAVLSVVSGIKYGIQRLSNIAFTMGLIIMFICFYLENTWYLLNVFTQSLGYYIQYLIQLGSHTSAFESTYASGSLVDQRDMRPVGSSSDNRVSDDNSAYGWNGNGYGSAQSNLPWAHTSWSVEHNMVTESLQWMDGWTLFYWGWWIAWSPFVGTFMAKISKGRTIKQFILGSCLLPVTYIFVWFAIFGGAGIEMERVAAKAGLVSGAAEAALIEQSTLNNAGSVIVTTAYDYTLGECAIKTQVHNCEIDTDCEWQYAKEPSMISRLSGSSKNDMWFNLMESYGQPDGFLGQFLFVFSMLSLVLYFVTSSDSGSLVIDILTANGVDEPPVPQRIFWACMEGLVATLLLAGAEDGAAALNALSTASIVAGLPYTIVLCFVCVAIWRALKLDSGELTPESPDFKVELADMFCDSQYLSSFFVNTLCPPKVIALHGNMFYTVISTLLCLAFVAFHFVEIGADGYWAVAWMCWTLHALILMDIRIKKREEKGIYGNIVEDFFASLMFHGGVLTQLENEFASADKTVAEP